jgi:hypothetical protein
MRSEIRCAPTPFIGNHTTTGGGGASSPPANDVWTTERRLLEKQPPGAPVRSRRRSSSRFETNESAKKFRTDCLLLPSRTIDEDDDTDDECTSPNVTLRFRPTRLFFASAPGLVLASPCKDPTTVLFVPDEIRRSWRDEDNDKYEDDDEDDDTALSPRLLRFGGQRHRCLSRYMVLDVAEADESEYIFRQRETMEDRESAVHDDNNDDDDLRHFASAPTMGRCPDEDDRV